MLCYIQPATVARKKSDSRARSRADADPDEVLDAVFHALADRTRRALLARLATGPASVSELAEPFDMSLPAVSKHIKVLERAGLITRAIDGRLHRCSLSAGPMQHVAAWLDPYRVFWSQNLDALAKFFDPTDDP